MPSISHLVKYLIKQRHLLQLNYQFRPAPAPHLPAQSFADALALWCSFHASVQLHEPGFEQWLRANAPPASLPNAYGYAAALDFEVEKAQTAFLEWPLLHDVEYEYVDTPAKVSCTQTVVCYFEVRRGGDFTTRRTSKVNSSI